MAKAPLFNFTSHDAFEHLKVWSGGRPVCKLSYWFWKSGSDLEKHFLGYVKSAVHDVLDSHPELILPLLTKLKENFGFTTDAEATQWTQDTLTFALKFVIQQSVIPLHFCLFVDGLDECEVSAQPFDLITGQSALSYSELIRKVSRTLYRIS